MKNTPFAVKTTLFRWAIVLTALIMLSELSLTACAGTPIPLPTEIVPVTLTPDNPRVPLTATPFPTPSLMPPPDILGSFQFLEYTYTLRHDFDHNACTFEPYVCPDLYYALLSDVYSWLYVQPGETYSLQFALDSRYQIQPIEPEQACQIQQGAQDANLIAVGCANTGEYVLLLEVKDTQQNVQYPLHLNVFSRPEQTDTPLMIPYALWVEEYELTHAPETDTRLFEPITGTASEILAKHQQDRGQIAVGFSAVQLENGAHLQAEVTAEPGIFHIAISQDGQVIFTTEAPVRANDSFLGLWALDNQWFAEAMRSTENSFSAPAWGEIFEDGQSLNELHDYTESFNFQLMRGKPFYFFERDGRVGIVYDGHEVPLGYDRVLHYGCCSAGSLSPDQYENMVGFFAVRDGKWYYVEIGAYEGDFPTPFPAQNGWTEAYTATIPVASVRQSTREEIVTLLFSQWLDHFKIPDADSRNGIEEYEILQVEFPEDEMFASIKQEKGVDYVAWVSFSVKPVIYVYSHWNAGNGTSTDQTWIRDKGLIIGVVQENGEYRLVLIGTG